MVQALQGAGGDVGGDFSFPQAGAVCLLSPASCSHFRLDTTANRARNDHFIRHSFELNRRALKSSSWLRFSYLASEEAFPFPASQTGRKGQSLSCLA